MNDDMPEHRRRPVTTAYQRVNEWLRDNKKLAAGAVLGLMLAYALGGLTWLLFGLGLVALFALVRPFRQRITRWYLLR